MTSDSGYRVLQTVEWPKVMPWEWPYKKELLNMNLLTISSKLAKEEAVFQKLTAANSNSWLGTDIFEV